MFEIFGSSESRRLKQLYEAFHAEMSTLQSLPDNESRQVLAAIGLYLREFITNPLFGDVRNIGPSRGEKLIAELRAAIRETMKQSPVRGTCSDSDWNVCRSASTEAYRPHRH